MEEYWRKFKYQSAYKLYQIMKRASHNVTLSEVDAFVSSKRTHQLHKKTRHNIQGHIIAFAKHGLWFADLLDMQNFSRQNKGFKYILLCVDVFTRRGYAQSLKSKFKSSVRDGFDAIFQELNIPVRLIITDSGKEFLNRDVQYLFKQLKIWHATVEVGDHNALGIIDRFSRTIKEQIFKDFTENNNVIWHDKLPDYMHSYNNSPHKGILNLSSEEAQSEQHQTNLFNLNLEKERWFEAKYIPNGHYCTETTEKALICKRI